MTLTLMALLIWLGVSSVVKPVADRVRIRLSPVLARITKRTRSLVTLMIFVSLLYELTFLAVFLTDHLSNLPESLRGGYWVSTGLIGIIAGGVGVILFSGIMKVISMLQIVFGIGLIGLMLLAIGITSM